ncbi:MAG: chromosomal replication initiator protein DnaA [Patescibacteria group bacterium]
MLSSIWNDFVQFVEQNNKLNPLLFSLLRQIKPVELQEEAIVISCENLGAKIFLEKRKRDIEAALTEFMNRTMRLEIVVEEKKVKKEKDAPLLSFEPSSDDMAAKAGLHRKYTFDNFAVSSTNQVAFAAAQSVSRDPGHSYNPLFLYGGVGNGKTHLAQAAARYILEDDSNKKIFFAPGDQFINELIEAIREKNTQKFRKKYRNLDMLIVDDIQFIAGKQTIQEEFFHTFNTIVSAGGQIILTSDRPPQEIKNLEDRLRSRFSGGLIVDIQPPDFELRTAILLIKAQEKNILIDMDAAKVIAEHISDTRALEGTLLSVYAQTVGKKDMIQTEDVDTFFSSSTEKIAKKINPTDVIKTVCSYYNVKQSHIKSPSRASSIALPRQIIMYLLRNELKLKLEEVAYILKRKDHTTIMHGVEKVTRGMMKDPAFKEDVDRIIQTLRSST